MPDLRVLAQSINRLSALMLELIEAEEATTTAVPTVAAIFAGAAAPDVAVVSAVPDDAAAANEQIVAGLYAERVKPGPGQAEVVQTFHEGLAGQTAIDTATGILMQRYGIGVESATDILDRLTDRILADEGSDASAVTVATPAAQEATPSERELDPSVPSF